MEILGVWIAAFLTLAILSFLVKDNPVYKFAEHLFVGVSAGFWLAYQYHNVLLPNLWIPLREGLQKAYLYSQGSQANLWNMIKISHCWLIIPGALGILMLMRLVPNIAWLSRWALAFIVGATAGLAIVTYLQANVVMQMKMGMVPLVVVERVEVQSITPSVMSTTNDPGGVTAGNQEGQSGVGLVKSSVEEKTMVSGLPQKEVKTRLTVNVWKTLQNLVLVFGMLCGLIYFFFSTEHKGPIFGVGAKIGIWVLMISFGASFGYTVMARISLLIGRMQFLLGDWLGLLN